MTEKRASLRISIPLGSFHLSGGVKVLVLCANGMARQGWNVRFIVPDYAAVSPFPLEPGIRVIPLPTGHAGFPRALRKIIYYLKLSVYAAREVDLCLPNYYLTAYCAFFSRLLMNRQAKIVWYIQAYEAGSHGLLAEARLISRWLRYLLAKLSYRLPVSILCVSRWVRDRIGRPDARIVNPPALNLQVFSPDHGSRDAHRLVIGTIGRPGATKGYDDFLKAVKEIREKDRIHLLVASPEPGEVPLPVGISSEAVNPRTESAMADFYRRCDVFVLPSRMEGFPLPPLEAMACGCTVVTTDCGGISEYAQDGVNCLVVPAKSPNAMAQDLGKICSDEPLRRRLMQEGLRTAQRYEQQRGVSELLASLIAATDYGMMYSLGS